MAADTDRVFVFADDGLSVFQSLGHFLSWVEWQDVEDGVYDGVFSLDGDVIRLEAKDEDVHATVTDRSGLDDLQRRLVDSRDRFESDPTDLRAVASELLKQEWDARWPKRPRWLDRRLHGDGPSEL
jgi:hypothetical protein